MTYKFSPQRRSSHPLRALVLFTQPSLFVVAAVLLCLQWRVPTLVRLELRIPWKDALADEVDIQARLVSGEWFPVEVQQLVVHYPEYPEIPTQRATQSGTLFVRPVDAMTVEQYSPDVRQQNVQIVVQGEVSQIFLKQEQQHDYRLTMFDRLIHSYYALAVVIALWLLLTAIGWVKVYQEL